MPAFWSHHAVAVCLIYLLGKGYCDRTVGNATVTLEDAILRSERDGPGVAVSRRRRYLIFPEGSSLQVVFCLTYPMILKIGDIFLMGATASLAWELPQNPYSPFRHHAEALHRQDQGSVEYGDPDYKSASTEETKHILVNRFTGKPIQPSRDYASNYIIDTEKYKYPEHKRRKTIINPAFAKRSVDNLDLKAKHRRKKAAILSIDRGKMHRERAERDHLKSEYMSRDSREFHRYSRCGLYEKIERLLRGMGVEGKDCVLKALCEMGQGKQDKQGSFLEEIMRVIFTLPKGDEFLEVDHQAYDEAHTTNIGCSEMYPKCISSLKTMPLR